MSSYELCWTLKYFFITSLFIIVFTLKKQNYLYVNYNIHYLSKKNVKLHILLGRKCVYLTFKIGLTVKLNTYILMETIQIIAIILLYYYQRINSGNIVI